MHVLSFLPSHPIKSQGLNWIYILKRQIYKFLIRFWILGAFIEFKIRMKMKLMHCIFRIGHVHMAWSMGMGSMATSINGFYKRWTRSWAWPLRRWWIWFPLMPLDRKYLARKVETHGRLMYVRAPVAALMILLRGSYGLPNASGIRVLSITHRQLACCQCKMQGNGSVKSIGDCVKQSARMRKT